MRRQDLLHRPQPPHLWAIIDEAALRRPVGGLATMRAQVDHLIEVASMPRVTVHVVPFSIGGHAAAGGPISILRLPECALPDVVYLEQLDSANYPDKPSEIQLYRNVMNNLALASPSPAASVEILRQIRRQT